MSVLLPTTIDDGKVNQYFDFGTVLVPLVPLCVTNVLDRQHHLTIIKTPNEGQFSAELHRLIESMSRCTEAVAQHLTKICTLTHLHFLFNQSPPHGKNTSCLCLMCMCPRL